MNHTSKKAFSSVTDWVTTGLNQVFSGSFSLTTKAGWHKIALDRPFSYNNSDNLLISFDDNTSVSPITYEFYTTDYSSNRTLYYYSDDSDINPKSPPTAKTLYTYCADIKMIWSEPSPFYTWDTETTGGIQPRSGTWGVDNYWTLSSGSGTSLAAWPGSGNTATFAGSDGAYEVTVNNTQNVDKILFSNSGYTLSSGTVNLGSNDSISVALGKTATISSVISGSGGLSLHGGGTLTLSGTNTYTGATTVSEGELHVTGSLASGSPVTVASGAVLGGTGTVSGAVACNGGIIPGIAGYGTLTIGNSLTYSGTGNLTSSIGGIATGVNYDQLVMRTGTLTLANASLNLKLNYTPADADAYTLINNAGHNAIIGTFNKKAEGSTVTLSYGGSDYDFTISYAGGTGNDVVLTYKEEKNPYLDMQPIVAFNNLLINDKTPDLTGSIEDNTASIVLKIGEQVVSAINNGDGTWILPGDSLNDLGEDSIMIVVSAKNQHSKDRDTGWVVVDVTPPAVEDLSPRGIITSLRPEVSLVFSEPVAPINGLISLFSRDATEPVDEIDVAGSRLKAEGQSKFKFQLQNSLKAGTGYFIRVDSGTFLDRAGNPFPGISGDTAWSFSTVTQGTPVIDSVTSPNAEGLYGAGDTVRLVLHFSYAMTLSGGKLNVRLQTNSDDGKIAVEKINNATSCTLDYVVQPGDSVAALYVNALSLESGAVLVNGEGKALVLAVGDEAALPARKNIRLDGIPPDVIGHSPASNTAVVQTYVRYTLNETVLSGKVVWQVSTDEAVHTHALSESDLAAGFHEVVIDGSSWERDVRYGVEITVVDSAGNQGRAQSDSVLLSSGIKGIHIVPQDTVLSLDSEVPFTAEGALAAGSGQRAVLEKVDWAVQGNGAIDGNGVFRAEALGRSRVVAHYNEYSDTSTVLVNAGSVTIGAKGDETVQLGSNISLILPALPSLEETVLHARYLDSAIQKSGMRMAGPAVVFGDGSRALAEAGKPVTLRLRSDGSLQDSASQDSVRVYARSTGSQGPWRWLEARRSGAWLELVQDTLQAYIVAIDTRKPTVELEGDIGPVKAGENLPVRWKASDNVANPRVYLRLHKGGGRQDSLIALPYEKDAVKNWELPGEFVSAEGLWYCIEVWDGLHRVAGDTVDIPVEITEKVVSKSELREGTYQMISFPLNIKENKVGKVLAGLGEHKASRWRLFAWDNEWEEMDTDAKIQSGRAYLLRTAGFAPEIGIDSGEARSFQVSQPFEIPLKPEWNCVSNPFLFRVDKQQVMLNNAPVREIFQYDNGEWIIPEKISFLEPWKGYAVWNDKDKEVAAQKLSIRPVEYSESLTKKTGPSSRGYDISISAVSGGFRAGRLELGFNYEDCRAGKDGRDWVKPPIPNNPLDISLAVPWEKAPYLADFRGPMHRGASWNIVVKNRTYNSLVLEFSGLTALPQGIHAVLMDRSSGKIHPLRQSGLALGKRTAAAESLQVAVGDGEYLEECTKAFERHFLPFSLANNCPNPFRTGTAFSFTLPYTKGHARGYQVTLSLYNIKGCLAGTVLRSKLPPGRHRFFWRRPIDLHAGVYFYRLEAGRFMAQNKMLILQ